MEADEEYSIYVGARWSALLRSAVLLGCTVQEAEDLVQTTLVNCYVSWDKVMKANDRDAYVYRVLVNAHKTSRRRWWWKEHPSEQLADNPATPVDDGLSDLTESVQRALAGLSVQSRAVVVLRFFADFSDQQTAEVLGIPVGTVKSRLSRALDHLTKDPNLADLPGGRPL